jgi:hypothetical protein
MLKCFLSLAWFNAGTSCDAQAIRPLLKGKGTVRISLRHPRDDAIRCVGLATRQYLLNYFQPKQNSIFLCFSRLVCYKASPSIFPSESQNYHSQYKGHIVRSAELYHCSAVARFGWARASHSFQLGTLLQLLPTSTLIYPTLDTRQRAWKASYFHTVNIKLQHECSVSRCTDASALGLGECSIGTNFYFTYADASLPRRPASATTPKYGSL